MADVYETWARAEELLRLNIEDLDLAGRCARVKSKGNCPTTKPDLLDVATATSGPGTGWNLHEFRHFKPSPQGMHELTSLIGPGLPAPNDDQTLAARTQWVHIAPIAR